MITVAENGWDIRFTTDTSYLALTGELWGVCCEDLVENWLHYNGTALYMELGIREWHILESRSINICRPWRTGSSLVHATTHHLFSDKQLPKAILIYCQLDHLEYISIKCYEIQKLLLTKYIWKCHLHNVSHFAQDFQSEDRTINYHCYHYYNFLQAPTSLETNIVVACDLRCQDAHVIKRENPRTVKYKASFGFINQASLL